MKIDLNDLFNKLTQEAEFIDLLSWYSQLTHANNNWIQRLEFSLIGETDINHNSLLLIEFFKDKHSTIVHNKKTLKLLNNEDRNPYALDELKRAFLIELIELELKTFIIESSLLDK